ncbi:MAG: DUF262 domain-containing HNH endonuclease family protein [Candidatus Ancillula sp.]|jgi:hypothetical protein|nr:DUF262 domain-containing HNH endonuclease family protein [Candidatus Ancillula sp.]
MSTSIEVNKESVSSLLISGKDNQFVIPEYQRPYAWGEDQCRTLWDDILTFVQNGNESTYFLGTVVTYINDSNQQEVIDGQQRITTLFLLLRAIYTKLATMPEGKEVNNFKSKIEPCIWDTNDYTGEVDNFDKVHISSQVITDEANDVFVDILKTGDAVKNAKDNYSVNYILFQNLLDEFAKDEPFECFKFFKCILDDCIMLPIECDTQDTALTIFSTLNDRGLPLSDADIFKAKIYNNLDASEKSKFIERWKDLDDLTKSSGISIQDLFYYYMFYVRAIKGDRSTTTPGLRKYFARDSFAALYNPGVMDDLENLANLWVVIYNREELETESWSSNFEVKKLLDCLKNYPNEFWKYPVSVFYLKYHVESDFCETFKVFCKHFLAFICAKFILKPTISAVKQNVLDLNIAILESNNPIFPNTGNAEEITNQLIELLKNPHYRSVRMLLQILAYNSVEQKTLLPEKWEIEHILPRKWSATSLFDKTKNEVDPYIEMLGNKIAFEKRLNIQANNGYFGKKKSEYEKSEIAVVKELGKKESDDWTPDDIVLRTQSVSDEIIETFRNWGLFGENICADTESRLTPELKQAYEQLKEMGVIND